MQDYQKVIKEVYSCKQTMCYSKQGGPTGKFYPEAIPTNNHSKNNITDGKHAQYTAM